MKVVVVPNKTTGALVTAYKNSPKYGFVQLQSESIEVGNGWIRRKKRACLVRAEVADLNLFVANLMNKSTKVVPGFISVQEYLESEVPTSWVARMNDDLEYEEKVRPYVKRSSTDGIELTVAGERILRFTDYHMSGDAADFDCFVQHDNGDVVREAMAAAKAGEGATLEGGEDDGETEDASLSEEHDAA